MHALAAFEAAARLQSFSRAAEELFVTQSAISHRIRQLEESIGVRLFVRVHQQVLLTPQGEKFLKGVREAMQVLALAASEVRQVEPQRRLRITSSPGIASKLLIPRLREYLARAQPIDIEIDTDIKLTDIAEEGFDLALRFGRGPWAGYESQLLLEERILPYCSPHFARAFGEPRTADMLGEATLIHSKQFSWHQYLRSLPGRPIAASASTLNFPEVWASIDAAVHGLGVVLGNQLVTLDERREGKLVPFIDHALKSQRNYFAVYRADSPRLELIADFIDWVRTSIREVIAAE